MATKLPQQEKIFRAEQHAWAKRSKKIVLDEVKSNLSGKVLKRKTHRTIRSLRSRLEKTGPVTDGFSISVGTRHGIAWEKGFQTPARTISPVKGIALRFIGKKDGQVVFSRKPINIPAMAFKARPFISKAIKDKRSFLEKDYRLMMERVFKKSFPDLTLEIVMMK